MIWATEAKRPENGGPICNKMADKMQNKHKLINVTLYFIY